MKLEEDKLKLEKDKLKLEEAKHRLVIASQIEKCAFRLSSNTYLRHYKKNHSNSNLNIYSDSLKSCEELYKRVLYEHG